MTPQEYISRNLIEAATNLPKSTIQWTAIKESWPHIEAPNPMGGAPRKLFLFDGLPLAIQRAIIAKALEGGGVDMASREAEARAVTARLCAAPEWNRERAFARRAILEAVEVFTRENGLGSAEADVRFSVLYKRKVAPGVEPWVYQAENGLSARKIQRIRAKNRENGLAGLLTGHGKTKGRIHALTPDMRLFIVDAWKKKPGIRVAHLVKLLKAKFGHAPARDTIKKFLTSWKQDDPALTAMMEDPRKWKNSFMPAFGNAGAEATYFCALWEMDSTPADVITADGKRCSCVGVIDVFSRRAKVFFAPTSKSTAIAACMRKALLSWGVPATIRKDNGKDYASHHMEAICRALHIHTPELPKYAPEKKPFIERFFGTMTRGLEELVPGYCGHSVEERQAIRERTTWAAKIMKPGEAVEVPYTMAELQAVSDLWLKRYEGETHRGLKGKTPLERARETVVQPAMIGDERALDVLLAPARVKKVQKKGLSVGGEFFASPDLVPFIGLRVEVRQDLENAGLVYVMDAETGEFLCTATNEPFTGERLEEYLKRKKENKRAIARKARALDDLMPASPSALQVLLADAVGNEEPEREPATFQEEANLPALHEAQKAAETRIRQELEEQPAIPTINKRPLIINDYNVTDKSLYRDVYDKQYYEEGFQNGIKHFKNPEKYMSPNTMKTAQGGDA